jgi:hypothetical protein
MLELFKNFLSKRELIRYGSVGLVLNTVMYSFYISLTSSLLTPVQALIFLYPLGILVGFFVHRGITFRIKTHRSSLSEIIKYSAIYIAGFFISFFFYHYFMKCLVSPIGRFNLLQSLLRRVFFFSR